MHAFARTPPGYEEIPEGRYYARLDALPPAATSALGFLAGEPVSHRTCRVECRCRAAFVAFVRLRDTAAGGVRYFEGRKPMTGPEFVRLAPATVLAAVAATAGHEAPRPTPAEVARAHEARLAPADALA